MTKQKTEHRGLYFFVGFLAGVICVWLACTSFFKENISLVFGFSIGPVVVSLLAFICRMKAIGFGILAALLTAPFIFFGTCLVNFNI